MDNEYYVSFLDESDNIILCKNIRNNIRLIVSTKSDEIVNSIKSFLPFDTCMVKYDRERNIVILQDILSDKSVTFYDSREILAKSEFLELGKIISKVASKNGMLDISEKNQSRRNRVRESKHNGAIIKAVGAVTLASSIVITSMFVHSLPKKDNVKVDNNNQSYSVSNEIVDLKATNNIFYDSEKNAIFIKGTGREEVTDLTEKPDNDFEFVATSAIDNHSNNLEDEPVTLVEEEPVIEATPIQQIEEVPSEEKKPNEDETTSVYLEFSDLSDSEKAVKAKENYYDIIERCTKKYGIDPGLILCIATQERGTHSSKIDGGGAVGLMQIQYGVWVNQKITYYEYNEETDSFEKKSMTITDDKIRDLESNIEIGCMILQGNLIRFDYNVAAAVTGYNMGPNATQRMIDAYAKEKGVTSNDIIDDVTDLGWLKYRDNHKGDPSYLENVNKWGDINKFTLTNVFTNEPISVEFTNENEEYRKASR